MPIVVDLDAALARRNMRLSELSARTGVALQNLSVLRNGHARAVRFSTLALLCDALACQPGDLLRYVPDGPGDPDGQREP